MSKEDKHHSCSLCFEIEKKFEKIETKLDFLLNKDTLDWHQGRIINKDE